MKAVGIITEYNPLHSGHIYQMKQARLQTHSDVVVVAMSGNFVQRGQPAFIDKWTRAKMAVEAGADVVVELPFSFACQAADIFSRGGVRLLSLMGCQALSFGSEEGTSQDFIAFAHFLLDHQPLFDKQRQAYPSYQGTYAQQMSDLIEQALAGQSFNIDWSKPNNLLGLMYCKENLKLNQPMDILAVKRQQADHHDLAWSGHSTYASSTAIRQAILEGIDLDRLSTVMPACLAHQLLSLRPVTWEQAWPYLLYRVLSQDLEDLRSVYQMTEGLEYRLLDQIKASHDFPELMEQLKTKRYSWTRLQRLMVYVLLGIKQEEMEKSQHTDGLKGRLLAMSKQGQAYLNRLKSNRPCLPWVSNLDQANQADFKYDIRAGRIYRLIHPADIGAQDFFRYPQVVSK